MTFSTRVTIASAALATLCGMSTAFAQAPSKPAGSPAAPTETAAAKAPAPAPAAPAATAPADAAATDPLIEPKGFTYSIEGRRDPFISLLRRGVETSAASAGRPAGLGGLGVSEITLRGTIRSSDGFVAIMQGADQKAYIVRTGDRLADGTVRTISQNDVVIVQQVNDPLTLEKQREVRKVLRQIEAN